VSGWDALERCLKAQAGPEDAPVVWDDPIAEVEHVDHGEVLDASGAGIWAPNLLLWTGRHHRPVLSLKEDHA